MERIAMSRSKFHLATVFVVGVSVATLSALSMPTAQAVPNCTNTNAYTTQCQGNGNAQIHTAPNPASITNPLWWPTQDNVGGFFFGFGGRGR
jgi:hypothetical protein